MEKWHEDFASLINSEFNERKRKNPKYSMRAFAQKLGISIGTYSDISHGKRELSTKRAAEILRALALPPETLNKMLIQMGEPVETNRADLNEDHHFLIREWMASAVLVYFDITDAIATIPGVSEHLGISPARAEIIVQQLIKKGLLKIEQGLIKRNTGAMQTSPETPTHLIRERHQKNLELAQKSVRVYEKEIRDNTHLCFAGNPETLELVRKEIRDLHTRVSALMKSGPCSEIYFLSVALHPVNKDLSAD